MNTFRGHLELSALHNLDRLGRSILCALGDVLNLVNDVVTFEDFSKDDVTAIEPAKISSVTRIAHTVQERLLTL